MIIEPITLDLKVRCPVEHAFRVWTTDIARWWPLDHTVGRQPGLVVVLEPVIGGRIYERHPDGQELDWGVVTEWEPPRLLAYTWHLGRTVADATDVRIRFRAVDAQRTRVEIEHWGWERLGAAGEGWRDRNRGGWASLLPHYQRSVEASAAS
jgi:uncharacterized protein YndB with AHSA1/START domain